MFPALNVLCKMTLSIYTKRVEIKFMTLSDYIKEVGDAEAGRLFGVGERTAASWRRGERRPRPEKAREIVVATGGKVSFSDCYAPSSVTQFSRQGALASTGRS